MPTRIKIALSSCLLGNAVRYDGQAKRNDKLINQLSSDFELVAVCPEVMAGLGVPRAKIQLVKVGYDIRALGVDDAHLDVSDKLMRTADEFIFHNKDICGLILKSKSPSCGLGSTKIFDQYNNIIDYGMGLFANNMRVKDIGFPIAEDTQLGKVDELNLFCQQVRKYAKKP